AIGAALEAAGVWQGELELLGAFGRRMPASVVVVAQRGADGRVEHFSAISRDISDIRSFEARLASNEAWYRSLVQHAPDLILVLGRDGTVLYTSPSCQDVLGITPDELVGASIERLASNGDVERLRVALDGARQQPGEAFPFEGRVRRPDGAVRTLEGTVVNL